MKMIWVLLLAIAVSVPVFAETGAGDKPETESGGTTPDVRREDRQPDRQLEQEIRSKEIETEQHGILEDEKRGGQEMEAEHQGRSRERETEREMSRETEKSKKTAENEVRKLETELKNKGIEKEEVEKSREDFNELHRNGFTPGESRSIVAKTVLEAHEQGLRGTALAERVKVVIRERIAEKKAEQTERKMEKQKMEKTK